MYLNVFWIYLNCNINMFECNLSVLWMFINVIWMCLECILNVSSMYLECIMNVSWMYHECECVGNVEKTLLWCDEKSILYCKFITSHLDFDDIGTTSKTLLYWTRPYCIISIFYWGWWKPRRKNISAKLKLIFGLSLKKSCYG